MYKTEGLQIFRNEGHTQTYDSWYTWEDEWEEIPSEPEKTGGMTKIIPIQFLGSRKLSLREPIYVSSEYYCGIGLYIVDSPELNIYGEGADEYGAILDFKDNLKELYYDLKKDKDKLGPSLQPVWNILCEIIKEKRPRKQPTIW